MTYKNNDHNNLEAIQDSLANAKEFIEYARHYAGVLSNESFKATIIKELNEAAAEVDDAVPTIDEYLAQLRLDLGDHFGETV